MFFSNENAKHLIQARLLEDFAASLSNVIETKLKIFNRHTDQNAGETNR